MIKEQKISNGVNNLNKKEAFKILIKEFHSEELPLSFDRDLKVPLLPKKVITVYGARRSGKSFYFYTLIKKLLQKDIKKERILYINFEDDRILPLTFKELNLLIEAYFELYPENKDKEIFLFLDEIQNIKNWEVFVRRIYDKEKVRIFITGSSSKLLSREIATSLRGRTLSFALFPLSFKEFLKFKEAALERNFQYSPSRFKIKKYLTEYLEWGGFPEISLEKNLTLKKKILSDYFKSLVYQDLIERFSLENSALLEDLLKFLFTNISGLFSANSYYRSVKQNLPVSRETVSSYLAFIEETGYFFFLPQFSYSLKVQKATPKKIIVLDNGLRNKIAFRFSQDHGKLAENLVGTSLRGQGQDVFYWKDKREVDFVVKQGKNLSGINVSFDPEIDKREIDSLLEFKERFKNVKELLLITRDLETTERKIKCVPLWKWLLPR